MNLKFQCKYVKDSATERDFEPMADVRPYKEKRVNSILFEKIDPIWRKLYPRKLGFRFYFAT